MGLGKELSSQLNLINLINKAGDVTIEELEARTGLEQTAIINILSEMVKRGMIELSAAKENYDGTTVSPDLQIHMKDVEWDSPEVVAKFEQFVSANDFGGAIHVTPTLKSWRSGL